LETQLGLLLVQFEAKHRSACGTGWHAPQMAHFLTRALSEPSLVLPLEVAAGAPMREAASLFLQRVIDVVGRTEVDRQEAVIERLAEVLPPDPLADVRGPLALDSLELRDRFVAETHPLTSQDVAQISGSKGTNFYATARGGQLF